VSSSQTGDPEKPPTIGWSPGLACSWNQPVACLPRIRPVVHTPSQLPSGKPNTRNRWSHRPSTRRTGGITTPRAGRPRPTAGARRRRCRPRRSAPSGAPAPIGAPAHRTASGSRPRVSPGATAAYGSAPVAVATTWAHVATRSGPTAKADPTTSPARLWTRAQAVAASPATPRIDDDGVNGFHAVSPQHLGPRRSLVTLMIVEVLHLSGPRGVVAAERADRGAGG